MSLLTRARAIPTKQVQKGRPRDGQMPERGVVEVKSVGDDAWLTANSDQVSRYWNHYRLVLVTNTRDFVLVSEDAAGRPAKLESFRLADSPEEFHRRLEKPCASAVSPLRTAARSSFIPPCTIFAKAAPRPARSCAHSPEKSNRTGASFAASPRREPSDKRRKVPNPTPRCLGPFVRPRLAGAVAPASRRRGRGRATDTSSEAVEGGRSRRSVARAMGIALPTVQRVLAASETWLSPDMKQEALGAIWGSAQFRLPGVTLAYR